jgi:hypothetical protein
MQQTWPPSQEVGNPPVPRWLVTSSKHGSVLVRIACLHEKEIPAPPGTAN